MGGGNESGFGEELKMEESLLSSVEKEVSCIGEEEGQQSWSENWTAASPPKQDCEAESSAESSISVSKVTASTLSSKKSSGSASKAPQKVPRKKSGKNSYARGKLLSYRPGSFMGRKADKFKIPEVTSLLVVGLRGSGKSAVINRIIRVIDIETSKFYRAPLSGSHEQSGTYFLSEYSICNGSVSLVDTRGFTDSEVVDEKTVAEKWMTEGVRDGQMELRSGDAECLQEEVKLRGRYVDHMLSKRRDVNFVIFVVNAAYFMDKMKHGETRELEKMKMLYEYPFFSFRDDRPVLVMTHTDKLSDAERIQAPFALAEYFKISAIEQIYDISGTSHDSVEVEESATIRNNVVEMLTTALRRADRHLPQRKSVLKSIFYSSDNYLNRVRNSDQLKFHMKILSLYLLLVSFIYLCLVLLRAHKSMTNWMGRMGEAKTVAITLPWLGMKMSF